MKCRSPERRAKAMQMVAEGPTLLEIPNRGPEAYFDYSKMSANDKLHCESRISEMLGSEMIVCLSPTEYFQMMAVIREKRCEALRAKNFARSDELDELMRQLSDFFLENKLYVSKAERVFAIQSQLDAVRRKLEKIEATWETTESLMSEAKAADMQEISDECDASLMKHDATIPSKLPPEFAKLSPETLNLYEQEKHLIGSRRYKEAALVHVEFLARKKKELEKQKDQYYQRFEKRRTQKEVLNEKKQFAAEANWERKTAHADVTKKKEIAALKEAIVNLEAKLAEAKAEYIGEDDPIINGSVKESLTGTTRPMKRTEPRTSTAKVAQRMQMKTRPMDSTRWPPKPTQKW